MGKAGPLVWIGLGEAHSKIEHLAKAPLQPGTAIRLNQIYLAKGAAATTAIEGNTLTEAEVLAAVQGKLQVPPSKEYLKQEVQNVLLVFNEIKDQIARDQLPPLTPQLICSYDLKVLKDLPPVEDVVPGVYRNHSVVVGTVYRGAPAEDCAFLMEKLCSWLDGEDFAAPKGLELVYAIIKAIVAHIYLAWIHPFGDGNGRTARLVEFYILMSAGFPMSAAHLLSNYYNQTRAEYYRQLAAASKSGGNIVPFIEYAVRGLVDGLRVQLEYVWAQNWQIAWESYTHELFPPKGSATNERRQQLASDLGEANKWVEVSAVTQLSPPLARLYAKKGPKTVQRDINALSNLGIIQREARRIKAKRELIFGFLPIRRNLNSVFPWPAPESSPAPSPVPPPVLPNGQLPLALQSPTAPEPKDS
jgi:Fic family protein